MGMRENTVAAPETETVVEETTTEETLYGKEPETKTEETATTSETTVDETVKEEKTEETNKDGETKVEETELTLTLPEDSYLGETFVDEAKTFAKENGLSQESAQGLLDKVGDTVNGILEAQQLANDKQIEDWRTEVENDESLGRDNLQKTINQSQLVVRQFGDDGFIKLLNETGYGNNPHVVKFLAKIGGAMGSDEFINPNVKGNKERSMEDVFYGNG